MMTLEEFRMTVSEAAPPAHMNLPLAALWWDAKGDWQRAHATAQRDDGQAGAWVHAYLHRKEGDLSNADHWYARAGKPAARGELAQEWQEIAAALLAKSPPRPA